MGRKGNHHWIVVFDITNEEPFIMYTNARGPATPIDIAYEHVPGLGFLQMFSREPKHNLIRSIKFSLPKTAQELQVLLRRSGFISVPERTREPAESKEGKNEASAEEEEEKELADSEIRIASGVSAGRAKAQLSLLPDTRTANDKGRLSSNRD